MPTPKTILITGASRGIGRATAVLAGQRGWSVAINYRQDQTMAESAAEAVRTAGGKAEIFAADVTDEAAVIGLFDQTEAAFGQIDAVVINAGVVAPSLRLADMTLTRMQQVVQINLIGALLCAREAARRLPCREAATSASITFISSLAARYGSAGEYVDYAATKGAIDTLTRGLSKELVDDNIRVNGVRPGLIDTDIHASSGQPGRAQRLAPDRVPMRRPGTADEIAEAILWLASDAATYTTGTIIDVGGGL